MAFELERCTVVTALGVILGVPLIRAAYGGLELGLTVFIQKWIPIFGNFFMLGERPAEFLLPNVANFFMNA